MKIYSVAGEDSVMESRGFQCRCTVMRNDSNKNIFFFKENWPIWSLTVGWQPTVLLPLSGALAPSPRAGRTQNVTTTAILHYHYNMPVRLSRPIRDDQCVSTGSQKVNYKIYILATPLYFIIIICQCVWVDRFIITEPFQQDHKRPIITYMYWRLLWMAFLAPLLEAIPWYPIIIFKPL